MRESNLVLSFFFVIFYINLICMKVKIINKSNNPLPQYATSGSAGMDLRANINGPITIFPMERKLIPTGIYIQLPSGYEAQIRPRSGLACKYGISVANSPGTIDSDYTGEVCVCLINLSNDNYMIRPNDRIAQMVISKYEHVEWDVVDVLEDTERGAGGFGHTGND